MMKKNVLNYRKVIPSDTVLSAIMIFIKLQKDDNNDKNNWEYITNIDELRTHLINEGFKKKQIKNIFDFIEDHAYDADTLKHDIEVRQKFIIYKCGAINQNEYFDDEYFDKIHDFYYSRFQDRGDYNFGFKFYYQFTAKNCKQIKDDQGSEGNNETVCDWNIEPKYKSLKHELLQNQICTIKSQDYLDVLQKAQQHFKSIVCKTKYGVTRR